MPTLADAVTALRAELAEVEAQYEHDPRFSWDVVTLRVATQVTAKVEGAFGLEVLGWSALAGGGRENQDAMELTITFKRLTAADGADHGFRGIAGEIRTEEGERLELHPED